MFAYLSLINDGAFLDGRRGLNPLDFVTPQDPVIQALAQSIITGLGEKDTPQSRLVAAYNYVTLNIKYVIDMTAYGYEEVWQKPSTTLERKLGDCEDLSFLLCSLLQALDIRSRVVLGEWKGKGHAWVEAYVNGSGGILETTSGQPFTGFADPKDYSVVGEQPQEDPFLMFAAYSAPGLICFGLGAFLMLDDAQDAMKIISDKEGVTEPGKHGIFAGLMFPELGAHIHHWIIGLFLVIIGIILLAIGLTIWMLKYL